MVAVCRPSIFSLDTCIYPMSVTCTHVFIWHHYDLLLGLVGFFLALFRFVCGSLWCEYGSFWSAIVAIFLVVGRMHGSKFEFEALELVLAISPSSNLGIAHCFFHGLLLLQGKFYKNFIFFLNRLDRSPKFQFRQNAWEQIRIRSTRACFGHISLIRPRNHAPFFFMDSLFFREPYVKI